MIREAEFVMSDALGVFRTGDNHVYLGVVRPHGVVPCGTANIIRAIRIKLLAVIVNLKW